MYILSRFYSSPSAQLQWRRGRFRIIGDAFERVFAPLTHRSVGFVPSRDFIFVGEPIAHAANERALLQADFDCQHGMAKLTFEYV